MCWSETASVAMVALGATAAVVTRRRGEPAAIWATLGYFTAMEALQAAGYIVIDQCGDPANQAITWASYAHISLQPLVINAFAMAIAPAPVSPRLRRAVYALAALASLVLVIQALPIPALGTCRAGSPLCGPAACLVSGEWHLAWLLPLNGLFNTLPDIPHLVTPFPTYFAAAFLLPLVYGAWRFVVFSLLAGPVAAQALTTNPSEMPAIWCLFSVGIALISLSPVIRHRVMGAARPAHA